MALMEAEFFSPVLGMCTSAYVIVPQKTHGIGIEGAPDPEEQKTEGYPVLYLLHGASDNHTIWLRRTSIERYVSGKGLVVVMPEAQLSSYENMEHGQRWFDYITEDLPRIMKEFFPITDDPAKTYVAGLSMGGMGALKMGLTLPERYGAVGVFSAGNFFYRGKETERPVINRPSGGFPVLEAVYGTRDRESLQGTKWDPYVAAVENMAAGKKMPRFFHACGTEDPLVGCARMTRDWFSEHPSIDYTYQEGPGSHNWEFWDHWVQKFLDWLE